MARLHTDAMTYLVVGLDRRTLAGWHHNVQAHDACSAAHGALSEPPSARIDLVVAAVIGPGSQRVVRAGRRAAGRASGRLAGAGGRHMAAGGGAAFNLLQVAGGDHAGLQRLGHQPRALLVLRQVLDAEALEQRAQVRLDRIDAEVQLAGDVLVGRRHRELVVLVGPREGDEDLALGRRQVAEGRAAVPATWVGIESSASGRR